MHLLERYALGCAAKIGKPFMVDHFYPLRSEKYITIHNSNKFESRNYDYWKDVLEEIGPKLRERGIKIVQLGIASEQPIEGVDENLLGATNMRQMAWIIKNAELHVGIDSLPVHMASSFGTPVVALYSNMHPSQSGPYWTAPEMAGLVESDRGGLKPSYSAVEDPKTINMIYPERIVREIFRLLKIEPDHDWETLRIGNEYGVLFVDYVPDFKLAHDKFRESMINVRMDICHDEKVLAHALSGRRVTIAAKSPISTQLLRTFRLNVGELHFDLDESFSSEYLYNLKKVAVPLTLGFRPRDPAALSRIRERLFDFTIEDLSEKDGQAARKNLDNLEDVWYKSDKFILSKGKVYNSKLSWVKGIPVSSFTDTVGKAEDCTEFWEEIESYRIFKKNA